MGAIGIIDLKTTDKLKFKIDKGVIASIIGILFMSLSSILFMNLKGKISLGKTSLLLGIIDVILIIFCLLISAKIFPRKNISYIEKNKLSFLRYYFLSIVYMILGYTLIKCVFISNVNNYFDLSSSNDFTNSLINTYTNKGDLLGVIGICIQIVIIGPILEELLFRGILLRSLLNKYDDKPFKAIIYSAMVFAFIHLNLLQIITAFGGGIILGLVYYYTKSIKLCIIAHFLNNFLVITPMPLGAFMNVLYLILGIYLTIKGIKKMRIKNST